MSDSKDSSTLGGYVNSAVGAGQDVLGSLTGNSADKVSRQEGSERFSCSAFHSWVVTVLTSARLCVSYSFLRHCSLLQSLSLSSWEFPILC